MREPNGGKSLPPVDPPKTNSTECVNWVTGQSKLTSVQSRRSLRLLIVLAGVLAVVGVSIAAGAPLIREIGRQVGEPLETVAAETTTHRELREPANSVDLAGIDDAPPAIAMVQPQGRNNTSLDASEQLPSQNSESAVTVVDDVRSGPAASSPVGSETVQSNAGSSSSSPETAPAEASSPTVAPTPNPPETGSSPTPTPTTAAPPRTTTPPTTAAPTTTEAPTTTVAPPPVPAGNAGHGGAVGCQGTCQNIGFQNLDNTNGVTLENVVISNPDGRCISIRNASNLTLRNVTIENCGTNAAVWDGYDTGMVDIDNSNSITIENSIIQNISAGHFGGARNNAVQIMNSPNITIRNNIFRDIHSNIANKGGDNGNRSISLQGNNSHNVRIDHNSFLNAGRNALQIKQARNMSGLSFTNNIVEGRGAWNSDYEDMVNMYSSSGRSGDPIVIRGNYMRNGGPSNSGTAIIVGDGNAGAGASQFILVERNVMVNPGHVGINLAGGDNIIVRDNIIYGNTNVPHSTTVGLIINHFGYSYECRDHVVTGNRVYMQNQHHYGNVNHVWITGSCNQNVRVEGNYFGDDSLNGGVWNP